MDRGLHGAGHGQRHDGEDEGYMVSQPAGEVHSMWTSTKTHRRSPVRSMTTIRHMAITAYRDWLWAASTSSAELCASRASTTIRRYPPPGAAPHYSQSSGIHDHESDHSDESLDVSPEMRHLEDGVSGMTGLPDQQHICRM